jgi:hypothetical protein
MLSAVRRVALVSRGAILSSAMRRFRHLPVPAKSRARWSSWRGRPTPYPPLRTLFAGILAYFLLRTRVCPPHKHRGLPAQARIFPNCQCFSLLPVTNIFCSMQIPKYYKVPRGPGGGGGGGGDDGASSTPLLSRKECVSRRNAAHQMLDFMLSSAYDVTMSSACTLFDRTGRHGHEDKDTHACLGTCSIACEPARSIPVAASVLGIRASVMAL